MVFTETFQCLIGHGQEKDHCILKKPVFKKKPEEAGTAKGKDIASLDQTFNG